MGCVVVYVHGLWFTGAEALVLRRRIAQALGAEERAFSYPSVAATISDNAAALGRFLASLPADTLHLVGHSLGGLVILRLFENPPALAPGRIVLLGSPVNGSRAAHGFARLPGARQMMGRGVEQEVLTVRPRRWRGTRDLGVIAGRTRWGLGRLVARLDEPNDGTILIEETRLAGATAQIVVATSHSGMLFSRVVARQTAQFLRHGEFEH
jgi:pimeloyl-ACP methyl ester carboxylesterase